MKWTLREKLLIETKAPKPTLQEAYAQEWLGANDEVWLNMAEDRNLVVHTYSEEQAQEIYEHIKLYAVTMRQTHDILAKMYPELLD